MIYSLLGKISEIKEKFVVIEVNGIGYEVFVSRISDFTLDKECKIYTHEKEAFSSLIEVKGIGPKTAISALSKTNPNDLFLAISSNDVGYLKKLPGIGPKAASQIILDLKGKLIDNAKEKAPNAYSEVRGALTSLGFKSKDRFDYC